MDLTAYFQVSTSIDIVPTILALTSILSTVAGIVAPILIAWAWISRNAITALQKQITELKLELVSTRKLADEARERYEKRQDTDADTITELKIRVDGFPARIEFLEKLVLELQGQIVVKDKIIAKKDNESSAQVAVKAMDAAIEEVKVVENI